MIFSLPHLLPLSILGHSAAADNLGQKSCNSQTTRMAGCETNNIECLYGIAYRNETAACEEISCSAEDSAST